MAEVKLTKNELRAQQLKLVQLNRYLPTLQLKKAMLQAQVSEARIEILEKEKILADDREVVEQYTALLTEQTPLSFEDVATIEHIDKVYENVAGVEVPELKGVVFKKVSYSLLETPPWIDSVIGGLQSLVKAKVAVLIAEEKKAALEKELREVSIRVNLFEKILIPRSKSCIKVIKVFLGDQQLAAVSQAKVAKEKIIAKSLLKKASQESAHAD